MTKTLCLFAVVCLLASISEAQSPVAGAGNSGGGVGISTVALAPTNKPAGTLNVMTDGNATNDCVAGGGANLVLCRWSGSSWGQFAGGTAAAGGANTQLQWNNASAIAGIAQWTTNGTTTITGSATSVFDLHAAGVGGLLLPGALATGIVKVTNTTGAITILTAPAGTIVGTSDTQVLTNKDLTGAGNTFPTFNQNTSGTAASATNFSGSLVGDVTGIQGATVVAKINGNSVTTGAANNQALICTSANTCVWKTLPDCVGSSNALNFTAATNVFSCLSITTLSNPMTTLGDVIYGGAAGAVTRLAGPTATNSVPQFLQTTPSGGAATAPVWAPAGVPTNAQTGTTYTVAATDRASYITFSNASPIAVTLPQAGTTGFASNFVTVNCNIGAGTATITPTTSTISYTTGSAYTAGASTLALTTGQCAQIYSDNTNYFAKVSTGGSGSLSGMTAGQVPIAATATTVTSSEALAGAGAGITTGPASAVTTLDVTEFTGTGGQIADSGVLVANLTQTTATPSANQICVYGSTAKTCTPTTTLPAAAIPTAIPIGDVGSAGLSGTSPVTIASTGVIACSTCNTTAAVATPPFDKSGTGLSNPTADSTFTQPIGSTVGWTLNGTAPASVATATGTNASSILVVTAPTGGADSNATGTAGVGGSPAITAGAGGAGTGTNAVGGAGGSVTLTAGNGGASLGTGVNANGGNVVVLPGTAGSGGSGTAGKTGAFQVGSSAPAPVIGTAGGNMAGEGTAPTGLSANDTWYANSTNHCFDLINQTTDIGCALGNNGTNTAGASMTLDMSAAASGALKAPVVAGATAAANGVVDYDSTNNNTHIRTNGADSLAVGEAAAVTANVILKATDSTHSLATASSISDGATAGLTSTANMLKGGNTVRLTANATAITATTPGTTVLTFGALPVSTNFSFHCAILYNQQTAAAAGTGFAVQGATNAPTRLDAWGSMFTSNAGAAAEGVLQNLASTTATSVVTGTPSAITTVFQATLDGTIQVGASASTFNVLAFTGNASDSITIQAGSYCTLTP